MTSSVTQAPSDETTRAPVRRWMLWCAPAEAVGMTAAAAAARGSQDLFGQPPAGADAWAAAGLVVAGGLVEGVALGLAQRTALGRLLSRRTAYLLATVAVAGIGWAAAGIPTTLAANGAGPPVALQLAGGAALGAAMGALLGTVQATTLRGGVAHPWRWVGANALAWVPAMLVIFAGSSAPGPGWSLGAVALTGTATGLLAGGLLGAVLGWAVPSLDGPSLHNRVALGLLARGRWDGALVGLRLTGRVSGRRVELPVMYAEDAAGLVVVPGHPARKRWWRNLRRPAAVRVLHHRRWGTADATLLRDGDEEYAAAVATYRRRWPRAALPAGTPVVRLRLTESR